MSNQPPALSDAEKLLAVCRVVWPGRVSDPSLDPDELGSYMVELGESRTHWYPDEGCLDDLCRVLLALTPEQVESFEMEFAQERVDKDRSHDVLGCCQLYGALTAPAPTILDALYRAVTNQ